MNIEFQPTDKNGNRSGRTRNLTGRRFGRLVALSMSDQTTATGGKKWNCECDCGGEITLPARTLLGPKVHSCGCYIKEFAAASGRSPKRLAQITTHGLSPAGNRHPLYSTWAAMWTRCTNANHQAFHRYGGRGIKVCSRWKDFPTFLADVGERPSRELTLDRKDNDGDYEPGNVQWATRKQQANNRAKRRASARNQVSA